MKILQVFTDFVKDMEGLSDTEAGRLFRAMLKYADTGEELSLRGAEKILWPVAKKGIDKQREAYARRCAVNKQNITNRYESLRTVTNGDESKQEKEKDKEKEKESINHLQSFIQSKAWRDDDDGLERLIESLQLGLYENGPDWPLVKQIRDTIRVMWRRESVKVNGDTVPRDEVRLRLKALKLDHIDRILATLADMDPEEPVTNGQAYLMACIYNAPADFAVNEKRASWR